MKDIKGFEGEYQIDTEGNTYSCKFGKRRLLKPYKNKDGYLTVGLYKDGKEKRFLVHRLVAEAFLPNPDNLSEVNHKNEDKTDNRVENLEFCDHLYNMRYGTAIKRRAKKNKGKKRPEETKRKMSESHKGVFINRSDQSKTVLQYTKDGLLIASYPSAMEAYRQTGYAYQYISMCCNGKCKQAYGYVWRYKL